MALSPEERVELASLRRVQSGTNTPSFSQNLSAGIDETQAIGGKSLQAAGEIFGIGGLADYGEEIATRNQIEAAQAAPPARDILGEEGSVSGLGDVLTRSIPSLGTMAAGAATGAAVGSVIPIPVIGTGIGATVGLGLAALGLNLGTVKSLEEMFDPESKSNFTTLAGAGAATVLDVLTGRVITGAGKQVAVESFKNSAEEATKKTLSLIHISEPTRPY